MKAIWSKIIFIFLWALTFFLFASQVNIKAYYSNPTEATIHQNTVTYDFEYKFGYPTPWYSRYYNIPDSQKHDYVSSSQKTCRLFDESCSKTKTPPDSYLVATDRSYDILIVQAILALIPGVIMGLVYLAVNKYAHTRH